MAALQVFFGENGGRKLTSSEQTEYVRYIKYVRWIKINTTLHFN